MKLSNVVVMCLSALLGLLMVCFTVIACTMVVNWSVPEEASILEGKVCSVQAFNADYEAQPLADSSAPAFADMDANADFDLVIDGTPDTSTAVGVWFFPAVPAAPVSGLYHAEGSFCSYAFPASIYNYLDVSISSRVVSSIIYDDDDYSMFVAYNRNQGPYGWQEVGCRLVYVSSSDLSTFRTMLTQFGAVKVSDSLDYEPVVAVDEPEKGSMISQVTDVFGSLGVWIADNFGNVMLVFYDVSTSQLTLLGILAVAALAVSVFFLLMSIIQNFLHFRG